MDLNLKKHQEDLFFLPLGGANEIGMNVNLYHLNGKWLMVDLGVGFASNQPGIDMMVADISFIKAHKKNLLGIVITHIHEDHMGAVQHLWNELEVPVYATLLAANFLKSKLAEYKLDKKVEKPIKKLSFWSKLLGKKEIIRLPEFDMYGYYKCPKCNEFTMKFNLSALWD